MYRTFFAGSPCAKTVSLARNLATFLPKPAESRNNFTLNTGFRESAFLLERGALAGTVRTWAHTIVQKIARSCRVCNSEQSILADTPTRGCAGWGHSRSF